MDAGEGRCPGADRAAVVNIDIGPLGEERGARGHNGGHKSKASHGALGILSMSAHYASCIPTDDAR
jgi:hypothetical protein